jgi:ribosomal protein L11 methylase PrmA
MSALRQATTAVESLPNFRPDPGSFRDRSNRVYDDGSRIWRGIDAVALDNWSALSVQPFFRDFVETGKVVRTALVPAPASHVAREDSWRAMLSHERIPFISYPYEWPFGMLKDAALLHLEVIERALAAGWTLKDASAFNVQWKDGKPVFIDICSFEPRKPGEPWAGYRQFCMMFLFPLMIRAYRGLDHIPLLRSNLEGIDPALAGQLLGGFSRFRRGVLGHVHLQSGMQRRARTAELAEAARLTESAAGEVRAARRIRHSDAMVLGLVQNLTRLVQRLHPRSGETTWQDYAATHSYADDSLERKKRFVARHAGERHRGLVFDLGCNAGLFSRIAAEHADLVVAMDGDANAIERLYQQEKAADRSGILPLVVDLSNPSPGQGWRGRERKTIGERGRPDLTICLALIHHLVISANIPLAEVVDWLAETGGELIIEFVSLDDAMSRMLLRNKQNQYGDCTKAEFERLCARRYTIAASESVKGGTRTLYHMKPQGG